MSDWFWRYEKGTRCKLIAGGMVGVMIGRQEIEKAGMVVSGVEMDTKLDPSEWMFLTEEDKTLDSGEYT